MLLDGQCCNVFQIVLFDVFCTQRSWTSSKKMTILPIYEKSKLDRVLYSTTHTWKYIPNNRNDRMYDRSNNSILHIVCNENQEFHTLITN